MGGAGDDLQPRLGTHARLGFFVHADDYIIIAAYDEKSGRGHFGESVTRQIRTPTARNNGGDVGVAGGSNERRGSAGGCSEIADGEFIRRYSAARTEVVKGTNPFGCRSQPRSQQSNVKAQLGGTFVHALLRFRQQIEEQRGHAGFLQHAGDKSVARAAAARSGTVGEQHQSARLRRHA